MATNPNDSNPNDSNPNDSNPNDSNPNDSTDGGDSLVTGSFDIASIDDQRRVRELADRLAASGADVPTTHDTIDVALACKIARSKSIVRSAGWTGRLAVLVAMWGEGRRLLPRSDDNPLGEDSLRVKLDQLEWLFDGTDVDWRLLAIDDGDPDDSASVAQQQARPPPVRGTGRGAEAGRCDPGP